MVERPIKKSERQVSPEASGVAEKALESEPNRLGDDPEQALKIEPQSEGKRRPNRQDRNKSSKKGRDDQQRQQETTRSNPALLRGPKPTKPKPPVTHAEPAMTTDPVMDEEQDASTES